MTRDWFGGDDVAAPVAILGATSQQLRGSGPGVALFLTTMQGANHETTNGRGRTPDAGARSGCIPRRLAHLRHDRRKFFGWTLLDGDTNFGVRSLRPVTTVGKRGESPKIRRRHSLAFKANVALEAVKEGGDSGPTGGPVGSSPGPDSSL